VGAPQLVEEVQQKCQVRHRLLFFRLVGYERREALAVLRELGHFHENMPGLPRVPAKLALR
jgi:hypothetical protein